MKELITADRSETASYCDSDRQTKELLNLAVLHWENTPLSQQYIQEALKAAPESLEVAIAAYRYFFYKQEYNLALQAAEKIVNRITKLKNLPSDWQQLKPILINNPNDACLRLYVNAYLASGFILTKLKQFNNAYQIFTRVHEIDNLNEFGAKTMLDILNNSHNDEQEYN